VGCRTRAPQAALVRFVRGHDAWLADGGRARAPGRGAYLCSPACAERAKKNKRYGGLGAAASGIEWKSALRGERGRV
jgi:predicted RNA-binding protein YlxR (DUF448 family)